MNKHRHWEYMVVAVGERPAAASDSPVYMNEYSARADKARLEDADRTYDIPSKGYRIVRRWVEHGRWERVR